MVGSSSEGFCVNSPIPRLGKRIPDGIPYISLILDEVNSEFPLMADLFLAESSLMSERSLRLASAKAAFVTPRLLLGLPSIPRCRTSSWSPLWGSKRCKWIATSSGMIFKIAKLPSPLVI